MQYKLFYIVLLVLFIIPSYVSADLERIAADGVYIMGDGMEESQGRAKERAREDAKRAVSEKAAIFVESLSIVQNGKLTQDEIRTVSANVLHIESCEFTPFFSGSSIGFKCHMVALVDSSNAVENMVRDRRKLEDATSLNNQLVAENDRIKREMEELKARFIIAKEQEKNQIRNDVKKNEIELESMEWYVRGRALRYSDKIAAVDACKKAIKLNPKNSMAWHEIGSIYLNDGKYDESIYYFQKAVEYNPNNDRAWYDMAYAYGNKGIYSKSIEYLSKVVELTPRRSGAWYTLGDSYAASGDNNKAIECFRKAVEIEPTNEFTWETLGCMYRIIHDYRQAYEAFNRAAIINPKNLEYIRERNECKDKI